MLNPNILKWVGVADGVLLAAVIELGRLVPSLGPDTTIIAQILGVIGTIAGGTHLAMAKAAGK